MTKKILLGGMILSSALVLAGCQSAKDKMSEKIGEKIAEKAIEQSTGGKAKVDVQNGGYKIETKDGTFTAGQKSLDDIRQYVDIPSWMSTDKDNSVVQSEANGNISLYISLVSSKSLDETTAFWKDYVKTKGYENISNSSSNDSASVTGSKGTNASESLIVSMNQEDGKVSVSIIFSKTVSK